jgi:hypothetical protein
LIATLSTANRGRWIHVGGLVEADLRGVGPEHGREGEERATAGHDGLHAREELLGSQRRARLPDGTGRCFRRGHCVDGAARNVQLVAGPE